MGLLCKDSPQVNFELPTREQNPVINLRVVAELAQYNSFEGGEKYPP
jgi:hypothetical protein